MPGILVQGDVSYDLAQLLVEDFKVCSLELFVYERSLIEYVAGSRGNHILLRRQEEEEDSCFLTAFPFERDVSCAVDLSRIRQIVKSI